MDAAFPRFRPQTGSSHRARSAQKAPPYDHSGGPGHRSCESGERVWLFQFPSAPDESAGTDSSANHDPTLVGFTDEQLYEILDFPGLVSVLNEVAVDHPLEKSIEAVSDPLSATAAFDELRDNVQRFLVSPEYVSVTATIRFTDDAVSLGRGTADGVELDLFLRPRREPEKEIAVRLLFSELGMAPRRDYLAGGGRTRLLAFELPPSTEEVISICRRLFLEIHRMREDDGLVFNFLRPEDLGK